MIISSLHHRSSLSALERGKLRRLKWLDSAIGEQGARNLDDESTTTWRSLPYPSSYLLPVDTHVRSRTWLRASGRHWLKKYITWPFPPLLSLHFHSALHSSRSVSTQPTSFLGTLPHLALFFCCQLPFHLLAFIQHFLDCIIINFILSLHLHHPRLLARHSVKGCGAARGARGRAAAGGAAGARRPGV